MGKMKETFVFQREDVEGLDFEDLSSYDLDGLQRQVVIGDLEHIRDFTLDVVEKSRYYGRELKLDSFEYIESKLTSAIRKLE